MITNNSDKEKKIIKKLRKNIKNILLNFKPKKTLTEEKFLELLMDNNDKDNYTFEKKYANQEENLLKIYGEAESLNKKIKILVITDTHNTLKENDFNNFLLQKDYDVCILLGDIGNSDLSIILKYIEKDKIYALLGNHDYNYIDEYELKNLNGNIIEIKGVKFLGIQGSFRYKPSKFPSFSQRESIDFLKDKEKVDILVSHDGKFNSNAEKNPAHQGLFGITYYLFKNKIPYHIHGHIHESYKKEMINKTIEISAFNYEYIEL